MTSKQDLDEDELPLAPPLGCCREANIEESDRSWLLPLLVAAAAAVDNDIPISLVSLSVVSMVVEVGRRLLADRGSSNILEAPRFLGDDTGEIVVQHAIVVVTITKGYLYLIII